MPEGQVSVRWGPSGGSEGRSVPRCGPWTLCMVHLCASKGKIIWRRQVCKKH